MPTQKEATVGDIDARVERPSELTHPPSDGFVVGVMARFGDCEVVVMPDLARRIIEIRECPDATLEDVSA